MGAAGGQGGRSGTGPGRCCSHLGSADSPQVPVPGLSPSTGRWELPASPQPPASAALAIYTRPGRHPSPGNPETQQQPRHWTHPSVGHIPPAWLPPWAALPGPGRPCSTTATELHGAQPQEPAGTRAPCPAPGGLARGSPSVAAPAPTGAALGQGARLPSPSWRPMGLPPPSHSSSSSSSFSSQPTQPQGATGRFQPPPANSKRLLLSPRAPGDGGPWHGESPALGRGWAVPPALGQTQRALTSTGRVPEGGGGFGEPLVDYRVDVFGEVYSGHRAPARTWRREKTQGH